MKRLTRYCLLFAALFAFAAPSIAQEQQRERKLVKLEHSNAESVGKLLSWIRYYPSRELSTIILEGTPKDIAKAEEIIRAVDVPRGKIAGFRGSVELDAYFIAAGSEAAGEAIPALVEPVVSELQKRFPYERYSLLDSALVQVAYLADAQVRGQFSRPDGDPITYLLEAKASDITGPEGAKTIYLHELLAEWSIPYKEKVTTLKDGKGSTEVFNRQHELRIRTDVSIPEGKLVVVGKAGSPTAAEAIFLVLRARLVE